MVFQERLRDATGQDGGFGAGYEDVPLGFYRVRFRPARVDVWIHLTCAVRKGEIAHLFYICTIAIAEVFVIGKRLIGPLCAPKQSIINGNPV